MFCRHSPEDDRRQVPQAMPLELHRSSAWRDCGHQELEAGPGGGAGGLHHQHHEHPLTRGTRPVLLAVKPTPENISMTLKLLIEIGNDGSFIDSK